MDAVRDGGADRLARCFSKMPDKRGGSPHRHRFPRVEDKLPRKHSEHGAVPRCTQKGRQRGAVGVRKLLELPAAAEARSFLGVTGASNGFEPLPARIRTPFHRSARVRVAVDGNEVKVGLHCNQGGDPTGVLADLTDPLGDRVRRGSLNRTPLFSSEAAGGILEIHVQ